MVERLVEACSSANIKVDYSLRTRGRSVFGLMSGYHWYEVDGRE
jgi:hypothetical protein